MRFDDEYISNLFLRYKRKGILVDTNLLLLYFVGNYNPRRILSFERTKSRAYTIEEFILLVHIFAFFDKRITTPNILTEVSNLSGKLSDDEKLIYFSEFEKQTSNFDEEYTPSTSICSLKHFKNFGLTDSGIINLVRDKYLVLSDDGPLVGYLQNVGIDAVNFNSIRFLAWNR